MSRFHHRNNGNCVRDAMLYDSCRICGSERCDVCHEHDQPRGECEECSDCPACSTKVE